MELVTTGSSLFPASLPIVEKAAEQSDKAEIQELLDGGGGGQEEMLVGGGGQQPRAAEGEGRCWSRSCQREWLRHLCNEDCRRSWASD